MAVNNNNYLLLKHVFCAQVQHISHYYKVIMHHAYCMDAEYAIWTLFVKSDKIIEKIIITGKISRFRTPIVISIC